MDNAAVVQILDTEEELSEETTRLLVVEAPAVVDDAIKELSAIHPRKVQ